MSLKKLPINPFLLWIKRRIANNRNAIIIINGATGSGKTYSAISLGKMIAKELKTNFSVKTNLDFSFNKLADKMDLKINKKKGTVFVFEEVGAIGGGGSSREWWSEENKLFFSWLQTSRHQNQIFIMTCPSFDYLEAGARKLVHWQMDTNGIDYINKEAFLKPFKVSVNTKKGKLYFKYLRCKYNKQPFKLKRLTVPYIGDETAREYENLKNKYSEQLREKIREASVPKDKKPKTKIDKNSVFKLVDKGFSNKDVSNILRCSIRSIQRIRKENA